MTKTSDTQAVILSAASQRDDGAVLPLPDGLTLRGGALSKVMDSLKAKGLIDHLGTPRGDEPPPLRITPAGLEAIGVETEDDASEGATPADTGATSAKAVSRGSRPQARRPQPPAPPRRPSVRSSRRRPSRARLRQPISPRPARAPSRPR